MRYVSLSFALLSSLSRLAHPSGKHSPQTLIALLMQGLTTKYDAEILASYFSRRPWSVVGRLVQVTQQLVSLYFSLKFSPSKNDLSDELCSFLSSLGPTFVKLGQTLSTREDLVGRDIARALADLQMAAPPFDDDIAYDVISQELGASPKAKFQTLSEQHVAAASLGQVYKGTIRTGEAVAVKVQRPDVLDGIALDVYVLRLGLGLVRTLAGINSDIRNIADEVGKGLFAELDYTVEATQVSVSRHSFE
jgi:aarF domain-containing kinase